MSDDLTFSALRRWENIALPLDTWSLPNSALVVHYTKPEYHYQFAAHPSKITLELSNIDPSFRLPTSSNVTILAVVDFSQCGWLMSNLNSWRLVVSNENGNLVSDKNGKGILQKVGLCDWDEESIVHSFVPKSSPDASSVDTPKFFNSQEIRRIKSAPGKKLLLYTRTIGGGKSLDNKEQQQRYYFNLSSLRLELNFHTAVVPSSCPEIKGATTLPAGTESHGYHSRQKRGRSPEAEEQGKGTGVFQRKREGTPALQVTMATKSAPATVTKQLPSRLPLALRKEDPMTIKKEEEKNEQLLLSSKLTDCQAALNTSKALNESLQDHNKAYQGRVQTLEQQNSALKQQLDQRQQKTSTTSIHPSNRLQLHPLFTTRPQLTQEEQEEILRQQYDLTDMEIEELIATDPIRTRTVDSNGDNNYTHRSGAYSYTFGGSDSIRWYSGRPIRLGYITYKYGDPYGDRRNDIVVGFRRWRVGASWTKHTKQGTLQKERSF